MIIPTAIEQRTALNGNGQVLANVRSMRVQKSPARIADIPEK